MSTNPLFLRRSPLIGLGLVSLLAAACTNSQSASSANASSTSTSPPQTTVRMTDQHGTIVTALIDVAQKEGYFKANGLNVQLVQVSNGPAAATALASGSVDVATNAATVFLPLAARGVNIQLIAGETTQTQVLLSKAGLQLPTSYPQALQALEGKKIGVTALNSNQQYTVQALFHTAGIPSNSAQFVATGKDAYSALLAGRVDAAILIGPSIALAEKAGAHIIVDLRSQSSCPTIAICGVSTNGMWARTSWITSHPTAVTAIRRSIAQADLLLHESSTRSQALKVLGSIFTAPGGSPDPTSVLLSTIKSTSAAYPSQSMQTWIDFSTSYHIIPKSIPIGSVYASGTPASIADLKALVAK